jgi:hypothetical protein
MSSAESRGNFNQQSLLQRISTPVFVLISLVVVPGAAFAALLLGIIICIIAGIEHTDAQTRVCLAALVVGFFGSIYLLVRARRSENRRAPHSVGAPPPLPVALKSLRESSIRKRPEVQIDEPHAAVAAPELAVVEDGSDSGASSSSGDIDHVDQPNDQARMLDWLQCWKAPVFIGGTVFVILLIPFQGNSAAISVMVWVSLLVAAYTLVVQLRGIHFNRGSDNLSYPMYFFRRSVRLSEIQDANCQTKVGDDDPFSFVIRSLGHTPTDQSKSKRYIANLSGEFGARRVVLHSKYKRDQFLSLLRSYAPQCRITRWT